MSPQRIARSAASVIAAPFAIAFLIAYAAWCDHAYRRALAKGTR